MKKNEVLYNLKQIAIIFAASLCTSVSLELLLLPSDVVIGGVLGIGSILDILLCNFDPSRWYMSVGVWVFAINVPIIVYCFLNYRKRFAVKTMLYVLFLSVELVVFRLLNLSSIMEKLINSGSAESQTADKVILVLLGGAIQGVSLPMVLSQNASTGGSDIVGLIVQSKSGKSASYAMRVILITNIVIVFLSALALYFVQKDGALAINLFVYSVAAMFMGEVVQERLFNGFSTALELEITTSKPQEMAELLSEKLKHGTTNVRVVGGYSHEEKTMVLCVINKNQLTYARKLINTVDPQAFAYVEVVKEVLGKGFANKESELENGEDDPV